jgi:hypothetical protein
MNVKEVEYYELSKDFYHIPKYIIYSHSYRNCAFPTVSTAKTLTCPNNLKTSLW